MRRAIWSGAVSFGLVNVPVKLFSAVSTQVVLRTKQYLAAIRPMKKGVLALSTMQYEDEIVPVEDVEGVAAARAKPTAKELHLATQLVEALEAKFDAGKFHDTYREKVIAML